MRKPLSRRTLLRGAGGAAVALPFLEAMMGKKAKAAAPPKRFIAMYTPCGTIPKDFWPTGSGTSYTLSPILEPLADHKADLLVLGGIDNIASLEGPGDAHQRGTGSSLTGTMLQEGEFIGMGGAVAGWADGISVNQGIAAAIGDDTSFPSLEFGACVQGAHVGTRICYSGPGRPIPPENSPYAMYKRLVGDVGASDAEKAKKTMRRQLVLSAVREQAEDLSKRLGMADRMKLEAHLDSLSSIEKQINQVGVTFAGECQPITYGNPLNVYDYGNMPALGKLQMDLIAFAMACDITRVSSLMWTSAASPAVYDWVEAMNGAKTLKITDGHHTIAHKGDEQADYVARNSAINNWYAKQMAYLIDSLKGIGEGPDNVFLNTSILWTNEQSTGNNHSRADMPYVLAGSAGGHFNTGRYVRFAPKVADRSNNEKGEPHNKLLVSLLQAYGVEKDSFGSKKYGTGPLANLT